MAIKKAALVPIAEPPPWAGQVDIRYIKQEQTNWCWAACAQMVLRRFGNSTVRQCDLAHRLFGEPSCCDNPSSPLCNEAAQVPDIAGVYSAWGRKKPEYVGKSVPFETLQNEINAKRPVEVGFIWKDGTGHQAIVCGWDVDDTGPLLLVNDPKYGLGAVYYVNLKLAYGWGTWRHTWISIT